MSSTIYRLIGFIPKVGSSLLTRYPYFIGVFDTVAALANWQSFFIFIAASSR
jgi:hypothetical protein